MNELKVHIYEGGHWAMPHIPLPPHQPFYKRHLQGLVPWLLVIFAATSVASYTWVSYWDILNSQYIPEGIVLGQHREKFR